MISADIQNHMYVHLYAYKDLAVNMVCVGFANPNSLESYFIGIMLTYRSEEWSTTTSFIFALPPAGISC